jgi:uncharacterized membrane protein YphA (DoxX/SURF4 family)
MNTPPSKNIALWIVQVLLGLTFLGAGVAKLSGNEQMVSMFELVKMGQWFRYFTGTIESVAGVLLFTPRFSVFGALLLLPTMVGAIMTHLLVMGDSFLAPAVLLSLSLVVVWGRKEQLNGLLNQ